MAISLFAAASLASGQGPVSPNPLKVSWMRYLPGNNADAARVVRVAPDGTIWVAGSTTSVFDFFGPNDPYQNKNNGGADVFLAQYRLNGDGGATLLFWTWLGGTGNEDVVAMELDGQGRIYLAGNTDSSDFPRAGNTFQTGSGGSFDAWVAVFDTNQSGAASLFFTSYYGGTAAETVRAMAVGPDGVMYVGGQTVSQELPSVSGNLQGSNRGGQDCFFIRVNPYSTSPLTYASFLGGVSTDAITGMALAADGRLWLSGWTNSGDFPITDGAQQGGKAGGTDAFVALLDFTRSGLDVLRYGTFWGGNGSDIALTLRPDSLGNLWIAGYTQSQDLPLTDTAAKRSLGWTTDAFLMRVETRLSPSQAITYSSYFGGSGIEIPYAIAPLADGRVALTGYVMPGGLEATPGALQGLPSSEWAEGFLAVIDPAVAGGIADATYLGGEYTDVIYGLDTDASGALYIAGLTYSTLLPSTDGSTKGTPAGFSTAFAAKLAR
ncbi:MAG: hypothetical protein SFV54_22820 [Bryobacteraceae bacterium]|nr:hypothetical protein [Bryobacteraceae bacterium]